MGPFPELGKVGRSSGAGLLGALDSFHLLPSHPQLNHASVPTGQTVASSEQGCRIKLKFELPLEAVPDIQGVF